MVPPRESRMVSPRMIQDGATRRTQVPLCELEPMSPEDTRWCAGASSLTQDHANDALDMFRVMPVGVPMKTLDGATSKA